MPMNQLPVFYPPKTTHHPAFHGPQVPGPHFHGVAVPSVSSLGAVPAEEGVPLPCHAARGGSLVDLTKQSVAQEWDKQYTGTWIIPRIVPGLPKGL